MKRLLLFAGVVLGLFVFGLMAWGDISGAYYWHNGQGPYDTPPFTHDMPLPLASLFNSLVSCWPHTETHWNIVDGKNMGLIYGNPYKGVAIGVIGFGAFCFAIVSFAALRWRKGIKTVLREAVLLFAPALILFEYSIWRYDPGEFNLYVTHFTPWAINGIYILSNSSVLFLASYLFLWSALLTFRRLTAKW